MSTDSPRFWTCHWQNRFWRDDINEEYAPVRSSGSNSFQKRGMSRGDIVYIISLLDGQLLLGGKMIVDRIVSRDEAVRTWQRDDLFDAREWIIGRHGSGSPLNLHRSLAPDLSRRLLFRSSKAQQRGLFFPSPNRLDGQATRGVHELTRESAELLDRIIALTDQLPHADETIAVTEQMLESIARPGAPPTNNPGDGIPADVMYDEGSVQRVLVDRYERDHRARAACIGHYGTICILCGFDFAKAYGNVMSGFIHVHHLDALASVGPGYQVDPVRDFRPVCPNCHAVLHRQDPPSTLDEVRQMLTAATGEAHRTG